MPKNGHRAEPGGDSGAGPVASGPVPPEGGPQPLAAAGNPGASSTRRLTVLGIYPWDRFWSMGEFRGAPSFFLAPQALVKAGHTVRISMPGYSGEAVEDYHGMKLHRYRFGIDFMPLSESAFVRHILRPLRFLYYILLGTLNGLQTARGVGPDVIVGYGGFGAPVAFLVARSLGLPNVTRLFGQSLSLGFEKGWRAKLKLFLNYVEIIAFLTPCSRLILHNDGSGGDKVAARLGVPKERLCYWRNGVDKKLFQPPSTRGEAKEELGVGRDVPVLLSASRLDREKHHERLINAMPVVLNEIPKARAIIVGDGSERAYLLEEAKRQGVGDSVLLQEAVSREALAAYYKSCDVFLTLSDRTNMSNPTDEAMACGCCVVALDVGDTSQAVRDGDTGVLVPPGDLERLGSVLVDLLQNEVRRLELGRRAKLYADEALPSVEERQAMESEAVASAAAARAGSVK